MIMLNETKRYQFQSAKKLMHLYTIIEVHILGRGAEVL
jgi:hypothetical protein